MAGEKIYGRPNSSTGSGRRHGDLSYLRSECVLFRDALETFHKLVNGKPFSSLFWTMCITTELPCRSRSPVIIFSCPGCFLGSFYISICIAFTTLIQRFLG